MPAGLNRILDRDLALAGIAKRDERGRTVDVHALRHTFGTHLSKGGVAPRTAQAAMRHGSIDLTMNAYTDPELLDVWGALDALPELPLSGGKRAQRVRATGTDGPALLAPMLAPNPDDSCTSGASVVKRAGAKPPHPESSRKVQKGMRGPLWASEAYKEMERAKGFEPSTSSLGS